MIENFVSLSERYEDIVAPGRREARRFTSMLWSKFKEELAQQKSIDNVGSVEALKSITANLLGSIAATKIIYPDSFPDIVNTITAETE